MTDMPEQLLELEKLQDQLITAGWITQSFEKASQKPQYVPTDEGLLALIAYQEFTDDLMLNIGTKESLIPVSMKIWETWRRIMSIQFADYLTKFDEPFIVRQTDWETGSSKFLPTVIGHNLFEAMLFWLSEKTQKKFYKKLNWQMKKESMGNWVKKELTPTKIMSGMVKASIKMGQVSDGMAKFAGETPPKKKRKWSGEYCICDDCGGLRR